MSPTEHVMGTACVVSIIPGQPPAGAISSFTEGPEGSGNQSVPVHPNTTDVPSSAKFQPPSHLPVTANPIISTKNTAVPQRKRSAPNEKENGPTEKRERLNMTSHHYRPCDSAPNMAVLKAPPMRCVPPNLNATHPAASNAMNCNAFAVAAAAGINDVNPEYLFGGMKLRRGKWTGEEEKYAKFLIKEFGNGTAPDCENGCSLRAYLSRKLHCAPMRISKKFAGKCIGKHVFLARTTPSCPSSWSARSGRGGHKHGGKMKLRESEQTFYMSVMNENRVGVSLPGGHALFNNSCLFPPFTPAGALAMQAAPASATASYGNHLPWTAAGAIRPFIGGQEDNNSVPNSTTISGLAYHNGVPVQNNATPGGLMPWGSNALLAPFGTIPIMDGAVQNNPTSQTGMVHSMHPVHMIHNNNANPSTAQVQNIGSPSNPFTLEGNAENAPPGTVAGAVIRPIPNNTPNAHAPSTLHPILTTPTTGATPQMNTMDFFKAHPNVTHPVQNPPTCGAVPNFQSPDYFSKFLEDLENNSTSDSFEKQGQQQQQQQQNQNTNNNSSNVNVNLVPNNLYTAKPHELAAAIVDNIQLRNVDTFPLYPTHTIQPQNNTVNHIQNASPGNIPGVEHHAAPNYKNVSVPKEQHNPTPLRMPISSDNYALFAQQSVMAVSQHSAYCRSDFVESIRMQGQCAIVDNTSDTSSSSSACPPVQGWDWRSVRRQSIDLHNSTSSKRKKIGISRNDEKNLRRKLCSSIPKNRSVIVSGSEPSTSESDVTTQNDSSSGGSLTGSLSEGIDTSGSSNDNDGSVSGLDDCCTVRAGRNRLTVK